MRRMVAAGMLLCAVTARGAPSSCKDQLPHALNFGVPRTSLDDAAAARLPETLARLVQPMYHDPCSRGKLLQINLAFGSDYEVLDWIERGSVDGGVVPDLSLWLLEHDGYPLLELNATAASEVEILLPRMAQPACRHYRARTTEQCVAGDEYRELLAGIVANGDAGRRRVLFASHLSSTGFLDPIEEAFHEFSKTIVADEDEEEATKEKRELLDGRWTRLFDAVYFAIDSDPKLDPFALVLREEQGKTPLRPVQQELIVISFPGEETVARDAAATGAATAPTNAHTYREHLLISSSAATLFDKGSFVPPDANGPTLRTPAFGKLLEKHPPRPLHVIVQGDPASGVRGYTFTIHESLRLIAQQQRSSGQADLALVLPGGGVKAAYQSKIVDYLYRHAHLRNTDLGIQDGALEVRSVLGTSGGALLGFFVSQLGEHGPFNLCGILWAPEGDTLQSKDVFATTDMLRYTSIVWTFLLFCIVLALVTGTHTSHFYARSVTPHGSWRWRLMTVGIVFIVVPILIRFVTGGDDIEHVPVIEGIFYSILTVLVMFCDQCIVYSQDDPEPRPLQMQVLLLTSVGVLFVVAAVSGAQPNDTLQEPVAIGFAFAALSVVFVGSPLLLLYASGHFGDLRRRLIDVLVSLVGVLLLAAFGIYLLRRISPEILNQIRAIGGIFALLMLIGLAFFAYWYAHLPKHKPIVGTLLTFLTLLSIALLCWPPAQESGRELMGWDFVTADAMETTLLAPFLASVGCLLLVIAAIVWVYQRSEYSMRNGEDFSVGLALLVAHALLTAGVVMLVAWRNPGLVHNVEMTKSFWVALTVAGLLLAALLLRLARRFSILRRAIRFLTSEHPNGSLVPRRYARMLGVVVMSLVWWNAIVAPALYGNDAARKYMQRAVKNFDRSFRGAAGQAATGAARGFIPTAKFVVPTNTLDDPDATRYFLFLTGHAREGEQPLDLPQRIAGAEWKVYGKTAQRAVWPDCGRMTDPDCASFVQDVIFSSGSPFPIFAAHLVTVPGETRKRGLIDGGYSNDIPIDAARTIAARQVLVVHSSRDSVDGSQQSDEETSSISFSPGMLIRNVKRLPSFMFERGQQVDRLSRQNLFVIGLAPLLERGEAWPGLAQFDAPTVDGMLKKAKKDLSARIGFAESWGEPRFRFSQQIAEPADGPATTGDRGSLPPAPPAAH